MAHGTPDWGVTAGAVTTYQLTDLAELAARLGSIVSFDRRGDVVLLDGFEDGLSKWDTDTDGETATVDLTTATARNGRWAVRLVGGKDDERYAYMYRRVGALSAGRCGLEVAFAPLGLFDACEVRLTVYDGTTSQQAALRYDRSNNLVAYLDRGGAWQTVASGLKILGAARDWNAFKVVGDFDTGKYIRGLFNTHNWDLSAHDLCSDSAPSIAPSVTVAVWAYSTAGWNLGVYLDDVILTQNEPGP